MDGLTNCYVDSVCHWLLKHKFLCVKSYDKFPLQIRSQKPCSLIINLSSSHEPGSHFVCIYITKKTVEYMDSYGLPPFRSRIQNFIKKLSKKRKYIFNNKCIQPMDSFFCGFYCIGFLISKDKKKTMNQFQKMFNNVDNDQTIINFIKQV